MGWTKILDDLASWEDCGTSCKKDAECESWAWSIEFGDEYRSCFHYRNSVTIDNTTSNQDWISGPKNCHTSLTTLDGCNPAGTSYVLGLHLELLM